MRAALEKQFPKVVIELIESKGGAFEIRRNGKMVFSKKETGRFPEHAEVIEALLKK